MTDGHWSLHTNFLVIIVMSIYTLYMLRWLTSCTYWYKYFLSRKSYHNNFYNFYCLFYSGRIRKVMGFSCRTVLGVTVSPVDPIITSFQDLVCRQPGLTSYNIQVLRLAISEECTWVGEPGPGGGARHGHRHGARQHKVILRLCASQGVPRPPTSSNKLILVGGWKVLKPWMLQDMEDTHLSRTYQWKWFLQCYPQGPAYLRFLWDTVPGAVGSHPDPNVKIESPFTAPAPPTASHHLHQPSLFSSQGKWRSRWPRFLFQVNSNDGSTLICQDHSS